MRTTTVVIGAGQAGLAMSWWLSHLGIDHVVLERCEVANTWKTERWDSLRLLTPNWQGRLPGGYGYRGEDPDGFRDMPETIAFLEEYARTISAPVRTGTAVTKVRRSDDGYEVVTDRGTWRAPSVVLATGPFNVAQLPPVAQLLPATITQVVANQYRNPSQLAEGGVLVVGAAATGAQLADEIQRSGRAVTLAVGEHVRAPRTYRGRDLQWWMDATGLMDQGHDEVDDITRARHVASFQLAGYPDRRNIDLNSLTSLGVKLVGRLAGFAEGRAQFSGSLRNVCALADLKLNRLLDAFDAWATERGLENRFGPPERFEPTRVEESPPLLLNLERQGIQTVVWATGFRPDYSWLEVPVLDRKGLLRHRGGIVESPGLYALGLPFMRRRKSSLIDGVGDDARDLSAHLAEWLATTQRSGVARELSAHPA